MRSRFTANLAIAFIAVSSSGLSFPTPAHSEPPNEASASDTVISCELDTHPPHRRADLRRPTNPLPPFSPKGRALGCVGMNHDGLVALFRVRPTTIVLAPANTLYGKVNLACLDPDRWVRNSCKDTRRWLSRTLMPCSPNPDHVVINDEALSYEIAENRLTLRGPSSRYELVAQYPIKAIYQTGGGPVLVEIASGPNSRLVAPLKCRH